MKTKTFRMNTGLLPICCVDTYWGTLNPDNFKDDDYDLNEFELSEINTDCFDQCLQNGAKEYIQDYILPNLQKYGVDKIFIDGIWHPREYNFETDQVVFRMTMKPGYEKTMKRYLDEFRKEKKYQKYIDENFKSRDGFISFMPESFDAIEFGYSCHEKIDEQRIAAYLRLCLLYDGYFGNNEINLSEEFMYEYLWNNTCNFLETKKIVDDEELLKLWANDCKWNDLYWDLVSAGFGKKWVNENFSNLDKYNEKMADSDAHRMLFWAFNNGYSVSDLYTMAKSIN